MAAVGVADGGNSSSCSPETNWRVAAGSLKRTVIIESSSEDSPRAASSTDSFYDAATPVVLKPEVSDYGPCEIRIHFLQKHEIRQIYVRSTARVYEVYYAKSWQSENEYLCTVRCGIAERDEQVLQALNIKDSPESTETSSLELKGEKSAAEGSIGTSEEDWVEVKVLDSSLENEIKSLTTKKNASMGRDIQDFYEATAEISDSYPCTSITLRFLSLQNKNCLCIDEVYVFSEPVSAIDSNHHLQDVPGSAGSSLMSLLVPTLLQFSKSGLSRIQGQEASSDLQNHYKDESPSRSTDLTHLTSHQNGKGCEIQPHVQVQRVDASRTEPAEAQLCNQMLDRDESNLQVKDDSAYGHIEKVLEQLVSRVGRIEEICLRFEDNMLKPLSSMEMRIQRVEQQLEELVNSPQNSGFRPCMRISAPSFSCNSNSSSIHNDGGDCQPCGEPSPEKKELAPGNLFIVSDGIQSSANVPHCLPSLVVTAPDFSCEENLDVDDGTKSPNLSPQESKRKPLIDDVLAASLSRFLSSSTNYLSESKKTSFISHDTSEIISDKMPSVKVQALANGIEMTGDMNAREESSRYTQVFTVTAPEFTSEENANKEHLNYPEFMSVASNTCQIDEGGKGATSKSTGDSCSMVTSDSSNVSKERACDQASISGTVTSAVFVDVERNIPEDVCPIVDDAQNHISERSGACSFSVRSIDDKGDEPEDTIRSDVCQTITITDHVEPVSSSVSGHKTDSDHITVDAGIDTKCDAAEGPEGKILQNLSEVSNASLVDFGIPILDVKFTPHKDSRSQLPLEALLDDVINHDIEADTLQGNGVQDACAQEINFIDIHEEVESGDPLAGTSLVMYLGNYDITGRSIEECVLDDSYHTCKQGNVASLI